MNKITIGITQGDTNGIGYEVIIKSLLDNRILDIFTPVIYGSSKFIAHYRKQIEGSESFTVNVVQSAADAHPRRVNLVQCIPDSLNVEPGKSCADGAKAALLSLEAAVKELKANKIQALVTAPFNKQSMQADGFNFPGHTEYLAHSFSAPKHLMMLCCDKLRVGVATGHIPLAQVPTQLTQAVVLEKILQLEQCLHTDFQISRPKIAVLGLNPHAGDGGVMGQEEAQIIAPAIAEAQKRQVLAFGPFPADGFFGNLAFSRYDAVLAMYHDQGLIPFKTLAFQSGVNYTAGLPIVRSSPDHGTAYDIAGTGRANADSMLAALYFAKDIYLSRQQQKQLSEHALKHVPLHGSSAE